VNWYEIDQDTPCFFFRGSSPHFASVLCVHDLATEEKVPADGFAVTRFPLMHNGFVLLTRFICFSNCFSAESSECCPAQYYWQHRLGAVVPRLVS
jgi:hypothetical protein